MSIKKNKSFVSLLLVIALLFSSILFSGCGNQAAKQPDDQEQCQEKTQERTIVDMGGKEVVIPKEVNNVIITCYGGATHDLVVLGASDKIIAQPSMKKFKQLLELKPEFKDLPDVGSFDDVSTEEVLKLDPDIVIASITSEKGNSKIEEVGIPVVRVSTGLTDVEKLKKEFMMLGQLLGNEEKAEKIVAYWDKNLDIINERISKIPQEKKKRVYYARKQMLETEGSAWWGDILINTSGGINVAHDLGKERMISLEQLIKWDPDVMLLSDVNGKEGGLITKDEIQSDKQLANLKAVEQCQLHTCPIGAFWWDRPCPDAILGFMWLSKTLYPETFEDIDIKKEAQYFYKEFYGCDLDDAAIEGFLNPISK